jgi:hypothetical protein
MPWRSSGTPAIRSGGRTRFVALAAIALVVSFAGSAGASALVTGRQIKDGSVTGRDVHAGTVKTADIRDGSLTPRDFTGGSVVGPQGQPGVDGGVGPAGPAGVSGVEYAMTPATVDPGSSATWTAACATPGKVAIAGGGTSDAPFASVLEDSAPTDIHDGWVVTLHNGGTVQMNGQAWVICASPRAP